MKKPAPIKLLAHFFTVVILMTCLSCEDDNIFKQLVDPPAKVLPPATQTGANTFGCKVNGKVWVPSETAWVDFQNGELNIQAKHTFSPLSRIYIDIGKYTIYSTGTYFIGSNTPYTSRGYYSYEKNAGVYNVYETDEINTGSIVITRLDSTKINYIISGIFSFKAKDKITGEVVEITEGRFDLKKQ